MKKRLILFILCLASAGASMQAQEWLTLEYNFGYGTYDMGKLKDAMTPNASRLNNLKVTDNFPGYWIHQVKLGADFKQMHQGGFSVDFMNTVGNQAVSDYSGAYNFTMRVKGVRLGAFYRITPRSWLTKVVRPYLQLSGGVILNNGELEEKLEVNQTVMSDDQMKLNGINSFIEPAVGCRFHLLPHFDLNVSVAYEFDLTRKFKDTSGRYSTVAIYPDWSGLRLMGGLIYSIPLIR